MKLRMMLIASMLALASCTSHVAHFVPPTVPVQLAENVKGVKVLVKSKSGELVQARADLIAGTWCVLDPADWTTAKKAEGMNLSREP